MCWTWAESEWWDAVYAGGVGWESTKTMEHGMSICTEYSMNFFILR